MGFDWLILFLCTYYTKTELVVVNQLIKVSQNELRERHMREKKTMIKLIREKDWHPRMITRGFTSIKDNIFFFKKKKTWIF